MNLTEEDILIRGDVRELSTHMLLAEMAIKKQSRLDVYINCAGVSIWSPIEEVDEDFWNMMVDTNLKGAFWGCKAAAKFLDSDLAGKRGSRNKPVYFASKFGVNG